MNSSYKIYKCDVTGYIIEYGIEGDIANMMFINCDFEYPKAFALLLRKSVNELKEDGINYVTQMVSTTDWDNYLKGVTTWTLETNENNICTIKCRIDDFLKNIMIGLGLNI